MHDIIYQRVVLTEERFYNTVLLHFEDNEGDILYSNPFKVVKSCTMKGTLAVH